MRRCWMGLRGRVCCWPTKWRLTRRITAAKPHLHWAAFNGRKEVTELLIRNRADVNERDNDGWTPLHKTASGNHPDVAEVLLKNKAEVDARNNVGQTPLASALQNGEQAVADYLREHGGHE